MKKFFIIAIVSLLMISCADNKTIDGVTYRPYGVFNEKTCRNDSIEYEVSIGAAVSGVLFFECVVPPIYTYGYNLWEPVGRKSDFVGNNKGVVK